MKFKKNSIIALMLFGMFIPKVAISAETDFDWDQIQNLPQDVQNEILNKSLPTDFVSDSAIDPTERLKIVFRILENEKLGLPSWRKEIIDNLKKEASTLQPLSYATKNGYIQIVTQLIDEGFDPSVENDFLEALFTGINNDKILTIFINKDKHKKLWDISKLRELPHKIDYTTLNPNFIRKFENITGIDVERTWKRVKETQNQLTKK